jgi:hypothetical protein
MDTPSLTVSRRREKELARATIYTVDPSGELTAMRPSEPRSEDFMQQLVARHPDLISDGDGELLLIRRELPVADSEDGGGRWSLDHLFVTKSGVPVLVELKRAVDTRLRREVVGQMLDYAANSTAFWQAGRIAKSFAAAMEKEGRDPELELASFLEAGTDPEKFWEQVDANFSAGRIKMVFVADTIPRELARIVEFLNEQMRADVRAIELSWFESESGVTALTPRVIGESERAQASKSSRSDLPGIGKDEWIETHLRSFGEDVIQAAHRFDEMVTAAGGHAEVTKAQGSIIAVFDLPSGPMYPMTFTRYGKGSVQLCLSYLASRKAFAEEEVRRLLLERLTAIVGPLTTATLNGFPKFAAAKLNDPQVAEQVAELLKEISGRARES